MRRVFLMALAAALLATSGTASAQLARPRDAEPWLRITPFIGQAPLFKRHERWDVSDGILIGSVAVETQFASGAAVGGVAELRLFDRFSLIGAGVYVTRKSTIDFETSEVAPGTNFLLAKAGLAMRLRERMEEMQVQHVTASIFAAPTLVREMPRFDPNVDAALNGEIDHYGLNLGVETEISIGSDIVALQLGAEDFIVWWNDTDLAARFDRAAAGGGFTTVSTVDTDPSHMLVFRAGLTLRIH